jgi:hypothetical protein
MLFDRCVPAIDSFREFLANNKHNDIINILSEARYYQCRVASLYLILFNDIMVLWDTKTIRVTSRSNEDSISIIVFIHDGKKYLASDTKIPFNVPCQEGFLRVDRNIVSSPLLLHSLRCGSHEIKFLETPSSSIRIRNTHALDIEDMIVRAVRYGCQTLEISKDVIYELRKPTPLS